MLIQVMQSGIRASANAGEVELTSLASVPFLVRFTSRTLPQALLMLLDEAEESRVLSWINANSDERSVFHGEVDTNDWLMVPDRRQKQRPAYVVQPPPITEEPVVFDVVPLAQRKVGKIRDVDLKTDVLIDNGFTVEGKVFSASDVAQLKWLGMYTSRADLSYPVTVPTKDDLAFVSLIEAADIALYYAALLARVQTVLTGGVTIKALIAATTTQAELDAIVDDRT